MTKGNQSALAGLSPLDDVFTAPATDERLERAAAGLRERGYSVHVVDSPDDARELVTTLLPTGKDVFTAASATLENAGINKVIEESGRFRSVRAQLATLDDADASIKLGAAPDVVVGSVHAVTEDGVMVCASASGSQLSSYAGGARRAIWVVGAQKVVPDLDTALRRVRLYCLPKESERCMAVYGQPSIIGKILILEREYLPERGTVVLVRGELGV
ncbi:LUD domain-containing protein [Acrocarpospora corrugata]|nr:LUD domain-containing protein [Acrocarpospora corrugata]